MADSPTSASTNPLEKPSPLVRVGCAGLPYGVSRAAYFQRLDLLETDATFHDLPREVALRRWHKEAPPGAAFTMLAWQLVTHDADTPGYARLGTPLGPAARGRVGGFRATDEVTLAWQRTLQAARALGAEVVVFQTPAGFSPSEQNRDALRRFFREVVGNVPDVALAWEPRGVWEPQGAAALAAELGIMYALDPLQLEVAPPDGPQAYFRLYGLGIYRNKIDDSMLDVVAEMVEGYERAWVVFANVEKYADAQRFRRLLAGREFVESEDPEDPGDEGGSAPEGT